MVFVSEKSLNCVFSRVMLNRSLSSIPRIIFDFFDYRFGSCAIGNQMSPNRHTFDDNSPFGTYRPGGYRWPAKGHPLFTN